MHSLRSSQLWADFSFRNSSLPASESDFRFGFASNEIFPGEKYTLDDLSTSFSPAVRFPSAAEFANIPPALLTLSLSPGSLNTAFDALEEETASKRDQVLLDRDKENPHVCPVTTCGRRYKRKGDLKTHCLQKHPELSSLARFVSPPKSRKEGKTYPCPIESCQCGYKWKRDLQRHILLKHGADFKKSRRGGERLTFVRPVEQVTFDANFMCKFDIYEKI